MIFPFDLPDHAAIVKIEVMGPHMTKYHLENGQVLHHFTQADTGEPHDHPFSFNSVILVGGYQEEEFILLPNGSYRMDYHTRRPGEKHSVRFNTVHRITALLQPDCWTLITPGEKVREPGFYRFEDNCILRKDWNGEWNILYPTPKLNSY